MAMTLNEWLQSQNYFGLNPNLVSGDQMRSDLFGKQYNEYVDSLTKAEQKKTLDTNYGAAMGSLTPAKEADVAEYQRTSPFVQRKLLGSLNARGLGSSVLAGGSGSGALSELAAKQQSGLQGIKQGYQGMYDELERQKAGDNIDMDSFYSQLGRQREYARQQQIANRPDFFDFAKPLVSGASLFI